MCTIMPVTHLYVHSHRWHTCACKAHPYTRTCDTLMHVKHTCICTHSQLTHLHIQNTPVHTVTHLCMWNTPVYVYTQCRGQATWCVVVTLTADTAEILSFCLRAATPTTSTTAGWTSVWLTNINNTFLYFLFCTVMCVVNATIWRVLCFVLLTPGTLCELCTMPSVSL